MTISSGNNTPREEYTVAQGVTQNTFTVPFEFNNHTDITMYVDGVAQTLSSSDISGGNGSTGTITKSVTGISGNSKVIIVRDVPLARTTDFPATGAFDITQLNTELDTFLYNVSDVQDEAERALRLKDNDASGDMTLPLKTDRANKVLEFDSLGLPIAVASVTNVATTSTSGLMSNTDKVKLDGIEANATADQTASEILTAIKTVDGATSGLDADLLDGQHGSHYLDYNNFTNVPTLTTTLVALTDTTISSVADNDIIAYDSSSSKFINQTPAEAGFATVATSGSYNDLSNTPTIPTNNNQLSNGAGYLTSTLSGSLDANGNEIILDGDGNSSIHADTDDQIDIKVSGTDVVRFVDGRVDPASNNSIQLGTASNRYSFVFGNTLNASLLVTAPYITSTVGTGTAPFNVSSTTKVNNLNADLLDGQEGSYYAPIASPSLTGTPTAPTASADTSTTQIATTAFVQQELAQLVDSAPSTLDTLNEIAAAINDDANFNTTVTTSLSNRLRIDTNSQNLTTTQKNNAIANLGIINATTILNGFMSAVDKTKLDGIETGATADQSDAEIKTAYENNSDTNALTDALLSKLNAIEASATADQTASEIRTLVESATDSNVFTDADHTKLNGIEANATADQTASELLTAIKTVDGPSSGLNADLLRGRTDTYLLDYNNFTNTPTIPTNNNQLTNGAGYITSSGNAATATTATNANKIKTTALSSFTNSFITFVDSNNGTASFEDVHTVSTLKYNTGNHILYASNFSGNGSSLTNVDADTLNSQAASYYLDYNNFTNTPTSSTPNNATITLAAGTNLSGGGNFTTNQSSNETITFNFSGTIPTATSDLTNDSGFISSTLSGSLDLNGNELILDADGDTSIQASSDDSVVFKVGGNNELILNISELRPTANNGLSLGSSLLRYYNVYGSIGNFQSTTVSSQMTSTVATGTAPMVIASTTKVANLNADLLDDQTGSYYLDYNNFTNTPTIPTATSDLTNDSGFITSVPAQSFSSLTGKPTTISGYGITDAFDGAYSSLTGTPTIPSNTSDLTNDSGFITSADGGNAQTLDSLDSTQFLRSDTADTMSGSLTITGNTEIQGGLLDIKNAGSQSELRMYCESNNAHYAALKAPAHADFSGNVDITLPATAGTLALTSSNITGNAATATTATNSDTVDNKHISVVTSLPSSPDANTIYFVTS